MNKIYWHLNITILLSPLALSSVLAGGSEHTNRGHTECVGSITMFSRRVDISR